MRAKSLILLVVALGCGMIAAVAVSKTVMNPSAASTTEATAEIFVAVKDIPTAQKLTADSVKLEKWPRSRLPEGALTSLEQLEGKFTMQGIFANEPILAKKISDSRESFATSIPNGYRVFDIDCTAGYIKPGDRVDITGTFKLKGRNSTPETRNVLRNVQVIGINGITTRDSEALKAGGKGTIFQLLVKESQLEALTTAHTLGTLQINLRPLGEGNAEGDETDNGGTFLAWLNSTSEEPPATERPEQVFSALANVFQAPPAPIVEPAKQMMIITPNGVTKYEWTNDEELPREVETPKQQPASSSFADAKPNPWPTSGNVPSGYGGYTPTYPTSTAPQSSATGATQPEPSMAEGKTVN